MRALPALAEPALSPQRQPASLSHAARACGLAFSHWLMVRVSLLSILLFMQVQYLRTTASAAPPALSTMHWPIHLVSSALWATAALANSENATNVAERSVFMACVLVLCGF